jgi:hypothetical protein
VIQPLFQGVVVSAGQQLSSQAAGHWFLPEQVETIEQLTEVTSSVDRPDPALGVEVETCLSHRPIQEARPEFDRLAGLGGISAIGGEVAGRPLGQSVVEESRLAVEGREGNEREVPVDLVETDAHGRELETIPKQAASLEDLEGGTQVLRLGAGAIEDEPPLLGPQLDVAGHWLVIKAEILGDRAEQDVQDRVFFIEQGRSSSSRRMRSQRCVRLKVLRR